MTHILIATALTEESKQLLHDAEGVTFQIVAPSPAAVREGIQNAHALIAREDVRVDAELLDQAPNLRLIARPSRSLDSIDIDSATRRGILVMNVPGISAIADGEFAFALMLALSRRLIDAHNGMRAGYWLLDRERQAGTQLAGKTLGIVGFGQVGQVIAQRALAFGMNVLANDPYIREDQVSDSRVILVGLRELLQRSDVVTLHVPLTSETRGLLDAEHIRQMKPGSRLINTAHGELVDEQALVDALKDGHLAGLATDVYAEEPPYNSPLVGLESVIHTPHISDNTVEVTQDASLLVVRQVLDALNDVDYRNVVNMPSMPGVDYDAVRPYLELAERIGTLQHVLARSPIERVAVEYRGEDVVRLVKPLTAALLKGLLAPVLGESVSYINAPLIASERGITVSQAKGLHTSEYTNLVSCRVTLGDGETITISGTMLDRREPHIIQINDYRMDFVPRGCLLILGSYDRPGVIGRVGMLMAENDVNIASWRTGRAEPGGQTLTVLTLDAALPDGVMDALGKLDFVRHAHEVQL